MGIDFDALEQELEREAEETPEGRQQRMERFIRSDPDYLVLERQIRDLFGTKVAAERENLNRLYKLRKSFEKQRDLGNWDVQKEKAFEQIRHEIRRANARRHRILNEEIEPLKVERDRVEQRLIRQFNED